MLNILHVIDTAETGGAETVFYDIITHLNTNLFQSYAILPYKGWLYDKLAIEGFTPNITPSSGSFNFKFLFSLIKIINKNKIDVIHSHLLGSNVYCSLAGLITRVPVIATFHGFVDATKHDPMLRVKFLIINKGANKIIFVSEQLKSNFITKMGASLKKSNVIYNGIDTNKFTPGENNVIRDELAINKDDILVGTIGDIRPTKGHKTLLEAASYVAQINKNIKFIVAGETSGNLMNEILEIHKDRGLEDTVFFLGFRNDIVGILNSLDIFVLPSTSEGFSIATIEAMACEVPVIVTRSGGPEEIVSPGENGLMVEPKNGKELSKAILELASVPQLRKNFAAKAKKNVIFKYQLSKVVQQYSKLYQSIAKHKPLH